MISVIITSYNEPKTIGRAIEHALNQDYKGKYEIIVCAPDKETLNVAQVYGRNSPIKTIKDPGKGKPTALNLAFKKARGRIVILTDGDVYVRKRSLHYLIKEIEKPNVGGVTGRVVSSSDRKTMFGFWSYLLTEGFHNFRINEFKHSRDALCSGYLYAIQRNLFENIPENILADDAYVSLNINAKGYKTVYSPKAEVYVKYPSNLPDWIRQKKRTAAKFYQLSSYFQIKRVNSLLDEIIAGLSIIKLLRSFKQVIWLILLIVMRSYIWFRIFFDKSLWERSFAKVWQRVESTK